MKPEHRARCLEMMTRRGELGIRQASQLIEAGFQTGRLLREATDEELLAIEGVGQGTLKKIRAWVGGDE